MSTGQWEVVGKNKKDKATVRKQIKHEKNKIIPAPKVEDILPLSQVKNIYTINKNIESKKSQEKNVKPNDSIKKQSAKKPEKKPEIRKPKTAKSIESALKMINIDDFKTNLELTKQRFPDAPLVWLRELSNFLNSKIIIELNDPVFSSKPDNYPLSAMSTGIKQIIDKTIKDVELATLEIFFDFSLVAMANDMSKGLPAIGHKLCIQFLAHFNPRIAIAHLEKHEKLKISYQNRQIIGLSILWAIGQAGFKNFDIGLKVFKEFMSPLFDTKNYSRFVIKYLSNLLTKHEKTTINDQDFIFLFDLININRNISKEDKQELLNINKKLKDLLFSTDKKYATLFEILLNKISSSSINVQKEILDILFHCLKKDSSCYKVWKSYKNESSYILLKYIGDHWRKLNSQLNKNEFRDLLNTFLIKNTDLSKHKNETIVELNKLSKILLEKMVVAKSYPWKFLTILIFITTAILIIYDVKKHGSWHRKLTFRQKLSKGVWKYGEKALDSANLGLNWTKQRIEDYAPGYLDATGEYIAPYIELSVELGKIAYNIGKKVAVGVQERVPAFIEMIEKQAPGLLKQIEKSYNSIIVYLQKGYNYLITEIFVGKFSPENLQKFILESFDSIQKISLGYIGWTFEKIQEVISGK